LPDYKKILVIRFSSFGDIVLAYPFLSGLKKLYPDSEINFLVKEKFSPLLKMHPAVDKIINFKNESVSELRKIIGENNFDIIFDIHKNLRSFFSTVFRKPRVIRYKKNTFEQLILVAFKINLLKKFNPVFRNYLLAIEKVNNSGSPNFTTEKLLFDDKRLIEEPYVLIAPSSKHFSKTLPKEYFSDVISNFKNIKFVLVGDDSACDKNICSYLESISSNAINYCGKTDFYMLANLIYNSNLVLCNDSGVLHLSEALNKKIIAFFGSTVREFGFYPQLDSTYIFENNNLHCRPCTHIGKDNCPKKHFKCMRDFDSSKIITKVYENIS